MVLVCFFQLLILRGISFVFIPLYFIYTESTLTIETRPRSFHLITYIFTMKCFGRLGAGRWQSGQRVVWQGVTGRPGYLSVERREAAPTETHTDRGRGKTQGKQETTGKTLGLEWSNCAAIKSTFMIPSRFPFLFFFWHCHNSLTLSANEILCLLDCIWNMSQYT